MPPKNRDERNQRDRFTQEAQAERERAAREEPKILGDTLVRVVGAEVVELQPVIHPVGQFVASCVQCHNADGGAPMPLTSFEEVRPSARAIKTFVS